MHRQQILELLKLYRPTTEEEIQALAKTLEFIEREPRCFERSCQEGHLTGSCWLENWDGSAALLTHHKKLGMWLQLGGHADGDSNLLNVAIREATEESGLSGIYPLQNGIFDLGVHWIPSWKNIPAHVHYDVRFLLKAPTRSDFIVSNESNDLRWLPKISRLDDLPNNVDVRRMFIKWCEAPSCQSDLRDNGRHDRSQDEMNSAAFIKDLAQRLLHWFEEHHRTLPWRVLSPGQADPYRVLLSEIMLQQTQVNVVIPYFEEFLRLFPTLNSVAASSEEKILAAWSGLGYYGRARRLRLAAQQLVSKVNAKDPQEILWPTTPKGWRDIAGVGEYTAAAVCALAFNTPVIPVDGNVLRIFTRFLKGPLSAISKTETKKFTQQWPLVLQQTVSWGDLAQALMDLGALVCRPQQPDCAHCPWKKDCLYAKTPPTQILQPIVRPTKVRAKRFSYALVLLNNNDEIYLEKGNAELLKSMLTIPLIDIPEGEGRLPATVHHTFSHIDWSVIVLPIRIKNPMGSILTESHIVQKYADLITKQDPQFFPYTLSGQWIPYNALKDHPVSSFLNKILNAARADLDQ